MIETAKRYPTEIQIPDEYEQKLHDLKARHEKLSEDHRVVSESLNKLQGIDPNSESERALQKAKERDFHKVSEMQQRIDQINL